MSRLRQPGDSHYDVLGVSPGATAEEINSAFRQLIDGEGYRVGVPLNRQWLRARQIKDAHATLSDPEARRAYDQSLSQSPEPAPWAMTANDPATDELVLPQKEPDASEPVEHISPPDAVVPSDVAPAGSEPEPEPDEASGPEAEEVGPLVSRSPPPADLAATVNDNEPAAAPALDDFEQASDPELDDNRRSAVRTWGMVAVVALCVGLVALASWPDSNRQPSTGDSTPTIAANEGQAGGFGQGFVRQALGNFNQAAASAEQQVPPPGESPAAPDALARDLGQPGTGDTAATQTGTTPTVAAPGAAKSPSAPQGTAEARPIAPAPTQPVTASAGAVTSAPGAARSDSPIRSEPQWIGGGPIDADNRRGRYQGSVAVQVTVEPDGRVSRCAPVRGSGNAGLDALTCRLVQERARFTPALDAQGRPVVSQTYTTFFWGRRRQR